MKNPYEENGSAFENPYLSADTEKSDFDDGFEQFDDGKHTVSDSENNQQIGMQHQPNSNPNDMHSQADSNPNDMHSQVNRNPNVMPYQTNSNPNVMHSQTNNNPNVIPNQSDSHANPYNHDYSKNPNYRQYQYYHNNATVGENNPRVFQNPVTYVTKRIFDRTDRIFATLSVLIGLFFIWFIFVQDFNFGVGATVCFTTTLFFSYAYIAKKDIEISLLHKVIFCMMALLCIPFTLYNNGMALAMDFVTLFFGTLYWTYSTGGKQRKKADNYLFDFCMGCFAYPFMNYGAMYPAIFRRNNGKKNGNIKWIILGLIIAIPVVALISALLIKSDEMFKAMFSAFFDNFLLRILEYALYTLLGLPIAMLFFSLWYSKYTEDNKQLSFTAVRPVQKTNRHVVPLALVYSIVIPMCIVYLMYLISQISYFISFLAEQLLPKDFTIVDYARRGFFELCIIAVINLVVILLIVNFSRQREGKTARGVNIITVLMSVFTIIFISTAIYKMSMYIKTYGYTPMRINTAIFMIFLFIVFIMIIIHQIVGKINLFRCTAVILLIFLGVFNVMNVDAFVAKENIRLYKEGKIGWMGTSLVYDLDDSAYEYIVPFAEEEDNGLTYEEKRSLHNAIVSRKSTMKYSSGYDDMEKYFPSFNVSRYRVYNILKDYDNELYDRVYSPKYYNDEEKYNKDYRYNYNKGV